MIVRCSSIESLTRSRPVNPLDVASDHDVAIGGNRKIYDEH